MGVSEKPEFVISPVVDLVPSIGVKKDTRAPEVLIRPVVDLRPTIVKKEG